MAEKIVKRRAIPFSQGKKRGHLETWSDAGPVHTKYQSEFDYSSWNGTQVTESFNHDGWRNAIKRKLAKDVGGNFLSTKSYVRAGITSVRLEGSEYSHMVGSIPYYSHARYFGPILPMAPNQMTFPPLQALNTSSLDAWGTKAIAVTKPTNPAADLSVFLGEMMREGLPSLIRSSAGRWESKADQLRHLPADQYLNLEFGWKPFIRELRSISNAIIRADAILAQYERDAGRVVRRRMEFPMEREFSVNTAASGVTPYIAPSSSALRYRTNPPPGRVVVTQSKSIRRWFSGAYTYHLPLGYYSEGGMRAQVAQAKKLLGLSLTPDVVWNLAPWSWAVDWVVNVGDVLSNFTDVVTDSLLVRYGYIMEHTMIEKTYTYHGPTDFRSGNVVPPSVTFVVERKARRRASPFGFGITWDGLTSAQLAILAALGITRS